MVGQRPTRPSSALRGTLEIDTVKSSLFCMAKGFAVDDEALNTCKMIYLVL
jgi:hypothetical protein